MPLSRRVAEFNRRYSNRALRHLASWAPGFAIVHHVGRRSGREYETPVNVFVNGDRFTFALTYGESEWMKNVLAAGKCTILTRRRLVDLTEPERVHDPTRRLASIPARWMLALLDVEDFVVMKRATKRQFDSASQKGEWDDRYGEQKSMWSGRPNGRLVAEATHLTPGRALDVGCGEGADAIWLAQHGWQVTAIDVSDVAIDRARAAADIAGVSVGWIAGDAQKTPLPADAFDLVSLQYPALPKASGDDAMQKLLTTVRPGGILLAVYHDLDDDHREHMKERGFDPASYVGADDLLKLLGNRFAIELHATEPRIDPPPDNPHIADVVIRARRD
jgi:deazaflavin-dependent oxidoreductase (nitroreductase family)